MQRPDIKHVQQLLTERLQPIAPQRSGRIMGHIHSVGLTALRACLPGAQLGELCRIGLNGLMSEVVGVQQEIAILSPFDEPLGIACGAEVERFNQQLEVELGDHLIGAVLDGFGRPLRVQAPKTGSEFRPIHADPPNALTRPLVDQPLPLGIRAIDGLLTCGKGQRVGVFAAAGVGKSTLLGMLMRGNLADVVVLALVGERGREVREFLDRVFDEEMRQRAVVVVATSDRPVLERYKAAYVATTVAEYFRDRGQNVLLLVDSVTRYARAARQLAIAAGEPMAANGYPPSVFASLPRLLERAGTAAHGVITGIYTVLVEADNMNEPVADEVRSILDGHIILSRSLAEQEHYPAIDVLRSISRVMKHIAPPELQRYAGKLRRLLARYDDIDLLVRVGEYQRGHDAEADEALDKRAAIMRFLRQSEAEPMDLSATQIALQQAVED